MPLSPAWHGLSARPRRNPPHVLHNAVNVPARVVRQRDCLRLAEPMSAPLAEDLIADPQVDRAALRSKRPAVGATGYLAVRFVRSNKPKPTNPSSSVLGSGMREATRKPTVNDSNDGSS